MKNNFKLFFFFLAVLIIPVLSQASTTILSKTSPNHTITSGSNEKVYGTSTSNLIILESGARAELINFPGQNIIDIQADSNIFAVSRSGTVVTFEGSDGTLLKISATTSVQTITFSDREPLTLSIYQGQVMLDDLEITTTPASISPIAPNVEHTLEVIFKGTENNVISEFPGEDIGLKVSALSTVESPKFTYQIVSSDLDFSLIDNEGNVTASVPDSAAPNSTLSLQVRVSEEVSQLTQEVMASVNVMQKTLVGSGTVSVEGGTVSDDTNSIQVEVPAGVLDDDIRIDIFEGETDDGRRVISFDTDSLETDTVKVFLPDLSGERESRAGSTVSTSLKAIDHPDRSVQSQIVEDYLNWDLQAIDTELNNYTWYMKLKFDPLSLQFNPYNFYYRVPGEKISSNNNIDIPLDELKKLKTLERQTFRLLSTYTDRSSLLKNDYVPVLFIHGYNLRGEWPVGHKYWGNFPYLMDQLEINGKKIKSFDFQWRTDSRFQDAASDLAKTIKILFDLTGNKKIHIIAHSFGGVLARCFLQKLYANSDNDTPKDYVASLISFGSPYSGIFDNDDSVFDEDDTSTNNILFPDGQHSPIIKWAKSVAVYQMGQKIDYGRMKKHLNLDDSPGEIVYELAEKIERIPSDFPMTIFISSIASNMSYGHPYPFPEITFTEGDGLISFKGQRFFPTLLTSPLLSVEIGNNQVNGRVLNINEKFMGFNEDTVPNASSLIEIWDISDLTENEIKDVKDITHVLKETLNYVHSSAQRSTGGFVENVQTYVPCSSIYDCTHEAFVHTQIHLSTTLEDDPFSIESHYIGSGPYDGCENPPATPKDTFELGESVVAYNFATNCKKNDTSHMIWYAPDGTINRIDNRPVDYDGEWCMYTGTTPDQIGQWSVEFHYNDTKMYTDHFTVKGSETSIEKHYTTLGPVYGCENPSPSPKNVFEMGDSIVAYNFIHNMKKNDTSHMIWHAPDGTSFRIDNNDVTTGGSWCLYTGGDPNTTLIPGNWSVDFYINETNKMYTDHFIVNEPDPQDPSDITIVSPNGGEIVKRGGTFEIIWEGNDSIQYVDIELFKTGDKYGHVEMIADDLENTGNHTWHIPPNGITGDNFIIRVSDSYHWNSVFDLSDSTFSIVSADENTSPKVLKYFIINETGWDCSTFYQKPFCPEGTFCQPILPPEDKRRFCETDTIYVVTTIQNFDTAHLFYIKWISPNGQSIKTYGEEGPQGCVTISVEAKDLPGGKLEFYDQNDNLYFSDEIEIFPAV